MKISSWQGEGLLVGRLLRRRHRFLVDVALASGECVTAHCTNPGRMAGLVRPGSKVWLSKKQCPKGNLRWTWEMIRVCSHIVGTNSWAANKLVRSLLELRVLPGLKDYAVLKSESVWDDKSRIDFELLGKRGRHLIEVKNCQLVLSDRTAYFPDSLTVRSTRHLEVLCAAVKQGSKASLLIAVQRRNVDVVRPSDLHDPAFASALRRAAKNGVRIRALCLEPTPHGFLFLGEIPVDLRPYPIREFHALSRNILKYSGWDRPKANPAAAWRNG